MFFGSPHHELLQNAVCEMHYILYAFETLLQASQAPCEEVYFMAFSRLRELRLMNSYENFPLLKCLINTGQGPNHLWVELKQKNPLKHLLCRSLSGILSFM